MPYGPVGILWLDGKGRGEVSEIKNLKQNGNQGEAGIG